MNNPNFNRSMCKPAESVKPRKAASIVANERKEKQNKEIADRMDKINSINKSQGLDYALSFITRFPRF